MPEPGVNGEAVSLDVGASTRPNEWRRVDPAALPELWPSYRPLVLRLLDRGDDCFDERDILAMLLMERWQLWVSENGLAISIMEVLAFPRKRVLLVRYAAGDQDTIVAGQSSLEDVARAYGCTTIEIFGRKGWERVLGSDWTQARTIMRKDVL